MTDFTEEFMSAFGPEVSQQVSSNLGIKKDVATQLIPLVMPLILGGLKRQMVQHGGEERVDHILNKYGSADVLDDIGGVLATKAQTENPDPRLGGLLGESGIEAADAMSQKFSVDKGTIMKLIVMLAPIILGALTKKRDQGGAGSRGIASLIDQNGDDSILDDVAGLLLQGLSDTSSKRGSSQGVLGSIISEFTRPRCSKCGSGIESNQKFCPECGNKL